MIKPVLKITLKIFKIHIEFFKLFAPKIFGENFFIILGNSEKLSKLLHKEFSML